MKADVGRRGPELLPIPEPKATVCLELYSVLFWTTQISSET